MNALRRLGFVPNSIVPGTTPPLLTFARLPVPHCLLAAIKTKIHSRIILVLERDGVLMKSGSFHINLSCTVGREKKKCAQTCARLYIVSADLCLLSFPRTVHDNHPCRVFDISVVLEGLLEKFPEDVIGEAPGHLDGRSIPRNPGSFWLTLVRHNRISRVSAQLPAKPTKPDLHHQTMKLKGIMSPSRRGRFRPGSSSRFFCHLQGASSKKSGALHPH